MLNKGVSKEEILRNTKCRSRVNKANFEVYEGEIIRRHGDSR
jgi:glycine betaine/proline transport system ATP-binding protein